MFGERTIPSFLIGLGLGYILWLLTGALGAIIALPVGAPLGAFIMGLAISIGIGLHGDMTERKKAS